MTHSAASRAHPASYRDPAGFIYEHEGIVYRQVNKSYRLHFDLLLSSGLYDTLVASKQLIPHAVVPSPFAQDETAYVTLQPEHVRFISYPYEWTFDMLRDAALLTLSVGQQAMAAGMMLKDASPYNVQWHNGRMVFIDSLSFERYDPGQPWIAYRQFCEQFLAPLALMHYAGVPLQPLLLAYPEGIPVGHAVKLLPWKSRWNMHVYLNLHLHAKYTGEKGARGKGGSFSSNKMNNIFRSLTEGISSLSLKHTGTWSHYYEEADGRGNYIKAKEAIIQNWLLLLPGMKTAIDIGANDGRFTALLYRRGIFTIAAEADHGAVNALYQAAKAGQISNVVPLLIDFTVPSPAIGFNNRERDSLRSRVHVDLVVSLAFIHHLAIGKNVPFQKIAEMYLALGHLLLIEFVTRDDEWVKEMLAEKSDGCAWYSETAFLHSFARYYAVREQAAVSPTRTLFLMQPHEKARH